MKAMKKITCALLCVLLIGSLFAGCSNSNKNEEADEITSSTMLVAYTAEKAPFLYKDENGELTGFDVELFKTPLIPLRATTKTMNSCRCPRATNWVRTQLTRMKTENIYRNDFHRCNAKEHGHRKRGLQLERKHY